MSWTSLPHEILNGPAAAIPLDGLPRATAAKLRKAIDAKRIQSGRQLFCELEPGLADTVADRIRSTLPLEERMKADLLRLTVHQLLVSVGRPGFGSGYYRTVQEVVSGWSGCSRQERKEVDDALAERLGRRQAAFAAEQERAGARQAPPAPLSEAFSKLTLVRDQLRRSFWPEGEWEVLTQAQVQPASLVVVLTDDNQRVKVSLQLPEPGQAFSVSPAPNEAAWVIAAIERVLDALADPRTPLGAELLRIYLEPAWARSLARLDEVLDPVEDEGSIGWKVVDKNGERWFRPVSCTPKKKGGWSLKNLDVYSLEPLRDPVDDRIRRLLAPWKVPPPEIVEIVAEQLIGHPRVFSAAGAPLQVRRAELALAFRQGEGGVVARPEIDGEVVNPDDLHEVEATWLRQPAGRSEIQVVAIRPEMARLAEWLSEARPVPEEGRQALLERITGLSDRVTVQLDPALRGAPIPGDERPLLRIAWDGATLRVEARVRPVPELGSHPPGAGPAELVTIRDGRAVHAPRDLAAEPGRVEEVARSLGLPERHRQGWTWLVPAADGALDVLLALADQAATVQTEWEGTPPSVQRARTSQIRMTVGSGRGWFEVKGSVQLDDLGAVALPEVLQAVREDRTFLQVRPGVFVRLADELRTALVPVAVADDDGRIGVLHAGALQDLADAGAEVEGGEAFQASLQRIRSAAALDPAHPTSLRAELRDYQSDGFRWLVRLASWAPGGVLADDMGLGKTLQAIALLLHRGGPSLVVCPLSVVANWEAELARFAPSVRVVRYHGADRAGRLAEVGPDCVLLTTWDVLTRDVDVLAEREFRTVVLDEAQAIKNASTHRSRASQRIRGQFVVALTGTPVENRSEELWSLFRVVAPGLLGSEARFRERFAGPIERGDRAAREALARLVRPFVLRRTKAAVAPELPPRTEVVLPVSLSADERALYERTRLEAIARTTQARGPGQRLEIFRWLTVLRQLSCNPRLVDPGSPIASSKLQLLRRRIADLRASGHRALIFSQFVGHLTLVREALQADGVKLRWLTGDLSDAERRREVAAFQGGDGDVFLISLGAGGTGLNLTAATYVFHLDPWWNPAKEDQASDRTHRIGQTQPVTVYRMVAEGTIEEQILALHAEKRDLADTLLAGASAGGRITTEELLGILAESGPVSWSTEAPGDEDRPAPAEPQEAAAAPLAAEGHGSDLLAAYSAALDRELAEGRIKTVATVRNYRAAVERLLSRVPPGAAADELARAAEQYLAGLADGTVSNRTDRTFARPAFRRLLSLVEEGGAPAK